MPPATVLLEHLADARRRGKPFAESWPSALDSALAAVEGRSGEREWREVLTGMASIWRDAFERRPPSEPERALRVVAEGPDRVPALDRECVRCHGPIPAERRRAIYCCEDCRLVADEHARPSRAAA